MMMMTMRRIVAGLLSLVESLLYEGKGPTTVSIEAGAEQSSVMLRQRPLEHMTIRRSSRTTIALVG